ncbi:hypothetical protein OG897_33855 [Streptomyces sp. NBC_00237]|uniref:hypothetical protein n=1 Tax=Streptomyces sp. NBC_00237 TaxID=2975687 RepID=UPI00224E801E|nr:hypothetical protein [Streptomyces sp. NBC_00237]MCX5206380.1 hypothetical protein [Streptomyces sp. NBC_00237]
MRKQKGDDAVKSPTKSPKSPTERPAHPARIGLALAAALATTALCATASAAQSPDASTENASARTQLPCPVVYFDLGETLIHTAEDGSTGYQSRAAAYLRSLHERHITVGLITNVPSAWGATDAERAARLRTEVDATWRGSTPFAWKDFGDRVLTPRTEAERKPAATLWQRARAGSGDCRLVFQGENPAEVKVAASLGFVSYQVGQPHRPTFLPAGLIGLLDH